MVTPKNEEVLWIFDFVCEKQTDGLQRLLSSINVVAKEEVISFWWKSSIFEKSKEVIILAMNVTANLVWAFLVSLNRVRAAKACFGNKMNSLP